MDVEEYLDEHDVSDPDDYFDYLYDEWLDLQT